MWNQWEEMTPAMAEGFAVEQYTPTRVTPTGERDPLVWAGAVAEYELDDGWDEFVLSNEPGYYESLRPWEF